MTAWGRGCASGPGFLNYDSKKFGRALLGRDRHRSA